MYPFRLSAALVIILLLAVPAGAARKSAGPAPAQAPDPSAQGLANFFRNEETAAPKTLDFKVMGGYADIRTETAESTGRYFLAAQVIEPVAPDIYKLDLTFKKQYQRDVMDLTPEYFFTQERTYYFWYNGGNKIVFKVGGAKKEFPILKKENSQIKVKTLETYTVEKTKLGMDLVIQDGANRIFLQIKFI